MSIDQNELEKVLASLLFAASSGLTIERMQKIISDTSDTTPEIQQIEVALTKLHDVFAQLAIDLQLGANGYRLHSQKEYAQWILALTSDKPPKYSKALLETLALIAYRQPITRGEIERVRGVSISNNIMHVLKERKWIRTIGHREVPGRPALLATTREFLDYFNIENLSQLPSLPEIKPNEVVDQKVEEHITQFDNLKNIKPN